MASLKVTGGSSPATFSKQTDKPRWVLKDKGNNCRRPMDYLRSYVAQKNAGEIFFLDKRGHRVTSRQISSLGAFMVVHFPGYPHKQTYVFCKSKSSKKNTPTKVKIREKEVNVAEPRCILMWRFAEHEEHIPNRIADELERLQNNNLTNIERVESMEVKGFGGYQRYPEPHVVPRLDRHVVKIIVVYHTKAGRRRDEIPITTWHAKIDPVLHWVNNGNKGFEWTTHVQEFINHNQKEGKRRFRTRRPRMNAQMIYTQGTREGVIELGVSFC